MKKLLLTSALAVLATLSSFGQGSVNFANTSTQPVRTRSGAAVPTALQGGTYIAELLYAADGTPATDATFGLVGTRVGGTVGFATPQAGVFNGGGRTVTSITPPGGFGLFQVRVWDTRAGATFEEAMTSTQHELGYSSILRVDTADSTAVPLPTPAALGMTSFQLSIVPEPSAIALGLLGVGTLLMLRRRK
jgi:hypothetical protein